MNIPTRSSPAASGATDQGKDLPAATRPKLAMTAGEICLYGFFLLLPLTYALQVLTGRAEVAILTYALLTLGIAQVLWANFNGDAIRLPHRSSSVRWLPLAFTFILVHHLISVASETLAGDIDLPVRGMLLFTVPLLLFWVVQVMQPTRLKILLVLLAAGGLIVAAEMIYENFSTRVLLRPAAFQILNHAYATARNSGEMTQLLGIAYRPPGLLEHLHAVTIFAALAAYAHAVLYCLEGRWYWLLGMAVCASALLLHGVRLPVAAAAVAFTLIACVFAWREKDRIIRRRGLAVLAVMVALVLIQLFVDPLGTSRDYYWTAQRHGDFQVPNQTGLQLVHQEARTLYTQSEWGKLFLGQSSDLQGALFGHGISGWMRGASGSSDDLFALALLAQYGILGAAVFFGLLAMTIYYAFAGLLRTRDMDPMSRALLYFSAGTMVILALSIAHSGVLQRKAIYPFFPLAAGLAWRFSRPSTAPGP